MAKHSSHCVADAVMIQCSAVTTPALVPVATTPVETVTAGVTLIRYIKLYLEVIPHASLSGEGQATVYDVIAFSETCPLFLRILSCLLLDCVFAVR